MVYKEKRRDEARVGVVGRNSITFSLMVTIPLGRAVVLSASCRRRAGCVWGLTSRILLP